ncbi:glycosyltransferase [Pseudomonas extremaustralis]|uniref:glycosyltransferase n=1 Tax=Pseudomonas extremaustralis TaxID=359110 RepID=UPI002307F091|nr:glycosyltransferase [Pseudomonas extremaustralis]MDB1111873.1 glycosyltransferase [Pseudomonas extremaustralis]
MTKAEFNGKKALVACSRLVDFAGAEIASIEIASTLSDLGFEVVLAAIEVGGVIESEMTASGISFVDLSITSLANEKFDFVWVSHYVVAYHLFARDRISASHGFYSSLSHFEPLETPPLPNIFFSQYLVHSQENFEHFSERHPHLSGRLSIFPNAAPVGYFEIAKQSVHSKLDSIGIISNHAPEEILELIELFKNSAIKVELVGLQGTPKRVTPKVISEYSAVITIGKSVQYCLAAGVPVYCYDRFGGPGWIVSDVFESAFEKNFSGRCTPRKISATQIFENIIAGYESTLEQSQVLRGIALDKFSLKNNLKQILNECIYLPLLITLSETEIEILSRESEVFLAQRRVINNYQEVVRERDAQLEVVIESKLDQEVKTMEISMALAEREVQIDVVSTALSECEDRIARLNSDIESRDAKIETFNMTRAEWEEKIAKVNNDLAAQENKITSLDHCISERESYVSVFSSMLSDREAQIARLSHEVSLKNQELQSALYLKQQVTDELSRRITELEHILMLSRGELDSILRSNSWKITSPIRHLVVGRRLQLAYMRVLLNNSLFVLRQEGVVEFFRRAFSFLARRRQRKAAALMLERFNKDEGHAVGGTTPLVSFVIPIYDRVDVLRMTVNSALAQTQQVFEVILITDGSPAHTLEVVEEFRDNPLVRIFKFPTSSGNAVRGRNKGILEAKGKYIAFLDSDDVAAPDRLEVCLPILESGVDVVYGGWRALLDGTREIDGLVNGQEVYSPDCDLEMLEKICVPCQSTVMVRRDTLLRTGFLKHRMEYREDHELWLRLAYNGAKFKSIPHVLTDLRLHAGNNELNFKSNDSHWEALLKEEYRKKGPVPKKIAFLLAGLGISGGAAVVLKHVSLLIEEGHDAFVIDLGGHGDIDWFGNPAIRVYRIDAISECCIDNIDMLFATFWTTVEWLDKIPAKRNLYLVQSDERLFYEEQSIKDCVAETYSKNIEYVGIASWIVDFLRDEFGHPAIYLPNGIDIAIFYPDTPLEEKNPNRPRVLIEGPISVPFKGMTEAYAAVSELDCELWIVSSDGVPEPHWRYDRFFQKVKQEDMRRIYSSCDILLKMSKIESFAYPPLEAMACGCSVVIMDVNGGIEYAVDGENVLKVNKGDVLGARLAVKKLMDDSELRNSLNKSGFHTVKNWSWEPAKKILFELTEF